MTTSSEKYNATSPLIQPKTENETQPSTGDTFHNVLLNNKTLLTKINNTNKYTTWYTIKNNNYVELQGLPIN